MKKLAQALMLLASLMLVAVGAGPRAAQASQDLPPMVETVMVVDAGMPGDIVVDRPVLSDNELPEDIEDDGGGNWWDQNKRWVLPLAIAIVATPLLLVGAYVACVCCVFSYAYY